MLQTTKVVRNSSCYKPNKNVEKSLSVSEYFSQYVDLQISGATVTWLLFIGLLKDMYKKQIIHYKNWNNILPSELMPGTVIKL